MDGKKMKKCVVVCSENCKSKNVLFSENITKGIKNRMLEKINNVNVRFLVLSVYKVQNRLPSSRLAADLPASITIKLNYEQARAYRNSRGYVLWPGNWKDLTVKVVL